MALTLIEALKGTSESPVKDIIMLYAMSSHITQNLPIAPSPLGRIQWSVQQDLPTSTPRALNADFSATNGTFKVFEAETKIYGGLLQADRKLIVENSQAVGDQKIMQIQSHNRKLTVDVLEGTGGNNIRGLRDLFLNEPLFSSQDVTMGSTGGGVLATPAKVLEMMTKVDIIPGNTFLYFTQLAHAGFANSSAHTLATTGIQWQPGEYGIAAPFFNGVEMVVLKDGAGANIMSAVETDTAITGGTACSIYCVAYGPQSVTGFSSQALPEVIDVDIGTNFLNHRIDHFVNAVPKKIRAAARLNNVKNSVT
jgi:hypothetical protein